MRYVHGQRVLVYQSRSVARRRGQYLPLFGERRYYIATAGWWLSVWWCARQGYRILGVIRSIPPHDLVSAQWDTTERCMAIRKREVIGTPMSIPALDATTKHLQKVPLLLEFVSATAYEDGAPRQPGYFTLRNRVIEWELTVYDPDAGARLAVRARTLDQVWFAVETLLGASEAPWEPDRYLQSLLVPKKKKK